MPFRLVAPDGVLYVINDTGVGGPDVEALKHRRSDLPPPKNFHQLFGWADAVPHGKRGKALDWQLLKDVKWAEFDGVFIPLVGSASNALKIFNTHCGTSHILDGRFRHLYSGQRPFEGGWRLTEGMPASASVLADGDSLVGLRVGSEARSRAAARAAIARMRPVPMMPSCGDPTSQAAQARLYISI